jgi:hypothetical protein
LLSVVVVVMVVMSVEFCSRSLTLNVECNDGTSLPISE